MLQPRYSAAIPIERGFFRLAHGDVHYRAAGDGPVVLALHESPRSSLSLLPVIEALADHYRVIAPDTPGYGLSDALPTEGPSMDAFLDVIEELLDVQGLDKVALYGAHTGAALAIAFAVRRPNRVTALVLDGLSAFTESEVDSFLADYLTPYEPHWDGRHVMGLWSRCKDLFTWFPWHERTEERRLRHDPTDVDALQRSALGFIQAGANYSKAYARAASFQPNNVIGDLKSSATVVARPHDLIAHHLDRLTPAPGWKIVWLGEGAAEWRDALLEGLACGEAPDRRPAITEEPPVSSRFVALGDGWLHAVFSDPVDGPVRLLVPDLPDDILDLVAREAAADPLARVVALSPPGCGWSDPLADGALGLEATIRAMTAAIQSLDLKPVSLAGAGAGAVLATLLARYQGWDIDVEGLECPTWVTGSASLPSGPLLARVDPSWDGSHLTAAWFQLRDLQLYDVPPGAGAASRTSRSASPDVGRLDRLFRSYVEGPDCADLLGEVVEHLRSHPEDVHAIRTNA